MYRLLLLGFATVAIVFAGWMHGQQTGRWGESDELSQAVERIAHIKMELGEWNGQSSEIDARQLKIGEIAGYASRTYTNRKNGDQVGVLLICGRPGPVSVHTPDVCYQGAGYTMGQQVPQALSGIPGQQPEFWSAQFTKEPGPQVLHILWSWSNGGRWQAPDHPRFTFYRSKYLYKLYIIRSNPPHDDVLVDEATNAFLREFLSELKAALADPLASKN
jgi:hypothetical protein